MRRLSSLVTPDVRRALLAYMASSLVVVVGVVIGYTKVPPTPSPDGIPYGKDDLLLRFAAWDGGMFMSIAEHGYHYRARGATTLAFLPGFPMIGRAVMWLTGASACVALLFVSHAFLIGTFIMMQRYLADRCGEDKAWASWSLVAFAFFPTTFFFRMAYSESMFLFFVVLVLYGLRKEWPFWVLALITGAAFSTRNMAAALLPLLLVAAWKRSKTWRERIKNGATVLVLGTWGIVAFMAYLQMRYHSPLLFAKVQDHFLLRPPVGTLEHIERLVTFEPLRATYREGGPAYWKNFSVRPSIPVNLVFANPIYFAVTLLAIIGGRWKKWLNDDELVLSLGCFFLAYTGRAHDYAMCSQARFAAGLLPQYLVWGRLLSRAPQGLALATTGVSSALMVAYAAYFAAWYFFV